MTKGNKAKDTAKRAESTDNAPAETLDEAIAKLSPEQAEMFVRALALAMRKRRLMLVGNLLALLLLVIGLLFAFVAYGNRVPGSFSPLRNHPRGRGIPQGR